MLSTIKTPRSSTTRSRDFFRSILPAEFDIDSVEIFLSEKYMDAYGKPLLLVSINNKIYLFLEQIAHITKTDPSNLLQKISQKGYKEMDDWMMLSGDTVTSVSKNESDKFGTDFVDSVCKNPRGAIVVSEAKSLSLLATYNSDFLDNLAELVVAIRTGNYAVNPIDERVNLRNEYATTLDFLKSVVSKREFRDFSTLNSRGDLEYYGMTTAQVKKKKGIPAQRALADFISNDELLTKSFVNKKIGQKIEKDNIESHSQIISVYMTANVKMRDLLVHFSIYPENIPIEEDFRIAHKDNQRVLQTNPNAIKKIA